jgi:SAM-dependent methyltransferase
VVADILASHAWGAGTVVELGCGAKQYSLFGADVTYVGIDLRSDLYGGAGPDVISDAQQLPFMNESVDLVFVVAAFHLMTDLDAVMADVRSILRPGGVFIIFDYGWLVCRRLGARHRLSTQRLVTLFQQHDFATTVYPRYAPARGHRWVRCLLAIGAIQRLAYYLGRWIIVSGRKI